MGQALAKEMSTDDLIKAHQQELAATVSTDDLIKAHQAEIAQKPIPYTAVEAGTRGAVQGGTAGFADEGAGLVEAGKKAFKAYFDPSQGLTGIVEAYRSGRDDYRQKDAIASKDQPIAYGAGTLGGSLVSTLVPVGAVAKGAGALKAMAGAAKMGAVQGLGTSQSDLTDGDVKGALQDTVVGAGVGATVQGLAGLAGPVAKGISSRASDIAESRAVKAVTGNNQDAYNKITKTSSNAPGSISKANKNLTKVGRDLLDEGVIGPLDKVEDIAPKLEKALDKYSAAMNDVSSKANCE